MQADPAVAAYVAAVGAGMGGQSVNNGHMFIALKPWDQRKDNADQVIARLDRETANCKGVRLFLQGVQDVRVGGRAYPHAVPVHAARCECDGTEYLGTAAPRATAEASRAGRCHLRPGDRGHDRDAHL